MLVADASRAFSFLLKDGQVVVAGDHCQLPPIIKGKYPWLGENVCTVSFSSCCVIVSGENLS